MEIPASSSQTTISSGKPFDELESLPTATSKHDHRAAAVKRIHELSNSGEKAASDCLSIAHSLGRVAADDVRCAQRSLFEIAARKRTNACRDAASCHPPASVGAEPQAAKSPQIRWLVTA